MNLDKNGIPKYGKKQYAKCEGCGQIVDKYTVLKKEEKKEKTKIKILCNRCLRNNK